WVEVIPEDCDQVVGAGGIRYRGVSVYAASCCECQVPVGADSNFSFSVSVEREGEGKVHFYDRFVRKRQPGSDSANLDPVEFRSMFVVTVDPDVPELVRPTCAESCIPCGFRSEVAFYVVRRCILYPFRAPRKARDS